MALAQMHRLNLAAMTTAVTMVAVTIAVAAEVTDINPVA
jgi:hypothetical protein